MSFLFFLLIFLWSLTAFLITMLVLIRMFVSKEAGAEHVNAVELIFQSTLNLTTEMLRDFNINLNLQVAEQHWPRVVRVMLFTHFVIFGYFTAFSLFKLVGAI